MPSETLPGVGTASKCIANKVHNPKPLRFVWHHILPKTCGGLTVAANLAEVCDNCHYGIHVLLFELAQNDGGLPNYYGHFANTPRYAIALQGYRAAVANGTVLQIPNEGED